MRENAGADSDSSDMTPSMQEALHRSNMDMRYCLIITRLYNCCWWLCPYICFCPSVLSQCWTICCASDCDLVDFNDVILSTYMRVLVSHIRSFTWIATSSFWKLVVLSFLCQFLHVWICWGLISLISASFSSSKNCI